MNPGLLCLHFRENPILAAISTHHHGPRERERGAIFWILLHLLVCFQVGTPPVQTTRSMVFPIMSPRFVFNQPHQELFSLPGSSKRYSASSHGAIGLHYQLGATKPAEMGACCASAPLRRRAWRLPFVCLQSSRTLLGSQVIFSAAKLYRHVISCYNIIIVHVMYSPGQHTGFEELVCHARGKQAACC